MPIDLTGLFEGIWSGFRVIPTPLIAIVLLGGPTAALIGHRLVVAGRRRVEAPVAAAALWICHDCRSANQLRLSRCYRCGTKRGADEEIELIIDQPLSRPAPFEVPVGSPFAAISAAVQRGHGVPVMTERAPQGDPVAVGPGRNVGAETQESPAEAEPVSMVGVHR
jgi:hypothetical protein